MTELMGVVIRNKTSQEGAFLLCERSAENKNKNIVRAVDHEIA